MTASRSAPTASSSSAIATPVRSLPAVQCTSTAGASGASAGPRATRRASSAKAVAPCVSIETYSAPRRGQLGESLLHRCGRGIRVTGLGACLHRLLRKPRERALEQRELDDAEGAGRRQPVGRHLTLHRRAEVDDDADLGRGQLLESLGGQTAQRVGAVHHTGARRAAAAERHAARIAEVVGPVQGCRRHVVTGYGARRVGPRNR